MRNARLAAWIAAGVSVLAAGATTMGQWSNAQLYNDASEAGTDVKPSAVCAAVSGGFHGMYHVGNKVRYRRYTSGGVLLAPVDVYPGPSFRACGAIAEALNGDLHIVFEDWTGDAPNCRWYKSTNGGVSWPTTQLLTSDNCSKYPHLTAYGTTGGQLLMTYARLGCDNQMYYARYNGTSWTAVSDSGSHMNDGYSCFGQARSPLDGSVYRTYDTSQTSEKLRQFANGTWGPETTLVSGSWPVRQHMAINSVGQIMIVWDSNNRQWSQIYTPGVGASTPLDMGACGYSGACDVCAIPNTTDFYAAFVHPVGSNAHVYGRRYTAGAWQAEESIQNGLADSFLLAPVITADPTGKVFCVWEYWGSDKPQQWYAVRDSLIPPGNRGTVTGTIRDNNGVGLPGASVVVSGVSGTASVAAGYYTMQVPVGTWTVGAYKNFYNTQSTPNVVVTNGGTVTVNFTLTATAPPQVGPVTVAAGNRMNVLSWTNAGGSYNGARIRYSTAAYPTSPTDGTFLADVAGNAGEASSYTHSNLTNGTIYYYSVFAYFQDASRYYAAGSANATGRPYGPGDFDHDGDVDQDDFGHLQMCLSGPYVAQTDVACFDAMYDLDNDVDSDDMDRWLQCWSGPGVPANPNCL